MIRPAAAAQMHADEQAERRRADGIKAIVALRSGTAEYVPLRKRLSDRNYRQGNEQDNVQGNTEEDDVQGNTKEDDDQDIDNKNNSPTALNAILPRMTRSTTRAAVVASGLGNVHHVFSAKAANTKDVMDPEVRVNAINKEVRGLFNRGAFSLVHVDAVPSHANVIGTRIITRLKDFGTIDEKAKARLIIQGCRGAEKNRIVSNASTVSHAYIRILISFAANKDYPVWTKDATQAFLQSKDTFYGDLFARLPLELRSVFKGYALMMLKHLYGTKEAETYWNAAYSGYWMQKVGVTSSTLDPCFMIATCNQAKYGDAHVGGDNHHAVGASVHAWSATDHCRQRYGPSIDRKAGLRRDMCRGESASGLCTGQIPPARLQPHWQGAIAYGQAAFGGPVKASTQARGHSRVY
jgi:Reverse transcriptase (RNA-dependent DNA polymerase)